jgi:ornithine cyclodeaminase/alanine dehydrogenase-like protein (mu-crystallin family)
VAGLVAVAAREMLVSGGVTMAVLGPVADTQSQLAVVARHLPDISHVALYGGAGTCLKDIEPRLVDQLELSGTQLSVAPTVADAVFGANLVIATDHDTATLDLAELRPSQLARGALLINATGEDLPTDIIERADQVFVDDLGLLDLYPHRYVVGTHPADRRIAGDLAQLLTGQHAGRRRTGDLVLVELLGVHELNADLAFRIYEVATQTGLGVRIAN